MTEKNAEHARKTNRFGRFMRRLSNRVKMNRRSFIIYSLLRSLVVVAMVLQFMEGNYEDAALCILALFLFLMPSLAEQSFRIEIPPLFEIIIYCFIYASAILGEINHYYTLIPGWDTMLHTLAGFLTAAIGFSMIDLLNRHSSRMNLSPVYQALMAFCFSMTIGVLWEFCEFFMDQVVGFDMQKDFIVTSFSSHALAASPYDKPVRVSGIAKTVIETASGKTYTVDGYIDLGIIDTMKDLLVNCLGAVVFSVIGCIHVSTRKKSDYIERISSDFLVRPQTPEETAEMKKYLDEAEANRKTIHSRRSRNADTKRQKVTPEGSDDSAEDTEPAEQKD